jgi:dihydrofolate reductase
LTYFVATSIDGFIAAPDGSADFFAPAQDVLDWIVSDHPDTIPTHVRPSMGLGAGNTRFDTVVMGRGTYAPALEIGVTSPYGHLDQYVVSRTLTASPDADVTVIAADPLDEVRRLKEQPGKGIWLAGGGQLAGVLLPAIDELVLKIYPVVAGSGIPLFATGFGPVSSRLTSSRSFDSGTIVATYTMH